MKKSTNILLLFIFTTWLANSSQAQVSLGVKGGLNVSNLNGIDQNNYKSQALIGFHAGGFATFNFGRNFAIQPELLYSTQGAKIENATDAENLNLNYFNIPVMIKFLAKNGFYAEAGPQIGFKVGDLDLDNLESSVENSDFAACVGLGFQPTKSAFGIGARYNIGMGKAGELNAGSTDNIEYKNGVFQLSLYWRIFGGGKLKKEDPKK